MASPMSRPRDVENLMNGKQARQQPGLSPKRQPLGELTPNAKLPASAKYDLGRKPVPRSLLKRSSISILDEDKGFQYLKRRKLSDDTASHRGLNRPNSLPTFEDPTAQSESVRFKPVRNSAPAEDVVSEGTIIASDDKATSTEPNTPSEEDSGRESQHSFTSLINYDPSSQQALQVPFAHSKSSSQPKGKTKPQHKEPRPTPLPSRAEILALRLRVAMYKVRTNQIYTPFSRLRINTVTKPLAKKIVLADPVSPASSTSSSEPELPVHPVATSRAPTTRSAKPALLPAPVLKPTAYSSRMIFGPPLESIRERGDGEESPEQITRFAAQAVEVSRGRHERNSSETTIVYAEETPVRGGAGLVSGTSSPIDVAVGI